ncbi:EAL domain-containing protein [Bacillus yapensis]|nr:EAL domain-containing protein [Bacillus yapensis]
MKINDSFFDIFSNISDCIFVVNEKGIILYMNNQAELLFDWKAKETMGRSINNFIPQFQIELRENQTLKVECKGNKQPHLIQVYPLMMENVSMLVLHLKNIQDRQNQKIDTLSKELANIKQALDESTIIAITDRRGNITSVNQKFCALSKYSEEELIGQNHRILSSNYHPKDFFREMWRTIGKGKIWRGEVQNKAKDGSLYWVDTTIVPFVDETGKPYQYVSIRNDITKRVQMERELQESMMNEFLDTVKNLNNGIFKMRKDETGKMYYTMGEGMLMANLGATTAILFNKSPFEVFENEVANIKHYHYEKAFAGERSNYEIELNEKLVYVDVTPIKHDGKVIEIVGSVHDITELRSTQKQLDVHQQQYQSLYEHRQDYVITYGVNGNVLEMNSKTMEKFGFTRKMISTQTISKLFPEHKEIIDGFFEEVIHGSTMKFDYEYVDEQDGYVCLNIHFFPIVIDGEIKAVYSIGKDVTEERKTQEMNAYLADHDELTNLLNRRGIRKKVEESLQYAEQNKRETAILLIDIDRFKKVNDTLGHFIGDELIKQISERLIEGLNGTSQFVARMGGDEFLLLCPIIQNRCEAINLAKNILEKLKYPFNINEYELFVSASIGISIYPTDGATPGELLKKADIALYQAKEQGRNRYQLYVDYMDERSLHSFMMERELRKALLNDEFTLHFQPRVNAKTKDIVAAEALIRWNHPKLGLVSPVDFIPLAEETGLIIQIGKWVKRKVCEQLVLWKEQGIPLIPISVNVSSQQFILREFLKEMKELLNEFQLDGKWLEIEITENSIMKNEEYIFQTMRELKEMGIRIYIDDFGTGYSSFNYLKTFKFDGIKIDRSFIQNISTQSDNALITTTMIKLAQHLKMDVIAEGVETKKELDFLLEQNCYLVQGFYFEKPCSIEEFENKFMRVRKV